MQVVELIKDLDKDRFISFPNFCSFIRTMPNYSKHQCFYLLLGITGFRPCEVARLTLLNFDFSDPTKPTIINRITKSKKKVYYDSQGRVIATKIIKIKRRIIPKWVAEYINEYIRRNYNTFRSDGQGSFYIFPSTYTNHPYIPVRSWCIDIAKRRKKLFKQGWKWVQNVAFQRNHKGKVVDCHQLSLYSFRKSRATWYGMELMSKGISDVLLNVSHFMGQETCQYTSEA